MVAHAYSSATWEAEAGELLEPWKWRLQWAKITPLHSSLDHRMRLHVKRKKERKKMKEGEKESEREGRRERKRKRERKKERERKNKREQPCWHPINTPAPHCLRCGKQVLINDSHESAWHGPACGFLPCILYSTDRPQGPTHAKHHLGAGNTETTWRDKIRVPTELTI